MPTPIPDEQAALLAAIVAQPDDDTPRLVYADWLQENGDEEQAQWIRYSITTGITPRPDEERAKAWLAALGLEHAALGLDPTDSGFERGLPSTVTYWCIDEFFEEASTLFARLPVRDLAIYWHCGRGLDEEALVSLAKMPELARLHALRLANYGCTVRIEGLRALIYSPHLRGLRTLSLGYAGLRDAHALALADCPNLAGLTGLDLSDNGIGPAGASAVVRSPHLRNVTQLSLATNNLGAHTEEPGSYAELHAAVAERFGNLDPLSKCFEG